MSRPLRFQGAGRIYHVMSRGNNKMQIYLDDLDYSRFLAILDDARERYELDMWLHCLMPNHYHLVLRTRRANLSLAIAHVNGTYGQWWNKRHRRVGHVYQGRFKAQVVEACTYLVRLCRYVLMNPVRSHLVSAPWRWKWSSYHALTGTGATGIDVESLLTAIDPDQRVARTRLLEYVNGYSDDEMAALVRRDHRVIGSDEFAKQFAAEARRGSSEVPMRERRTGTAALVTLLADAVGRGAGLQAGAIEAYLAKYPIEAIAECAGLSPRSVQRLIDAHGTTRNADADPPVSRPDP
jgi:putative transposase